MLSNLLLAAYSPRARIGERAPGGGNPEEELMAALMEEGGGAVDNTLLHAEDGCAWFGNGSGSHSVKGSNYHR